MLSIDDRINFLTSSIQELISLLDRKSAPPSPVSVPTPVPNGTRKKGTREYISLSSTAYKQKEIGNSSHILQISIPIEMASRCGFTIGARLTYDYRKEENVLILRKSSLGNISVCAPCYPNQKRVRVRILHMPKVPYSLVQKAKLGSGYLTIYLP